MRNPNEKLTIRKHQNYEWSTVLFNSDTGQLLPMLAGEKIELFKDEKGIMTIRATFQIENVELNSKDFDTLDMCGKVTLVEGNQKAPD